MSSGLMETTTKLACLVGRNVRSLLRYLAAPIVTSFALKIDFFDERQELVDFIWEDVGRDRVNCQLYSGWRVGKRKPEFIHDREPLFEVVGDSIEVEGR